MWYPRWGQRRKMKTEYETLVEQSQAQAKEGLLNPSTFVAPPQVEEPSLTQYSQIMHTPRQDSTRPADVFNQIIENTDNESYTRWYERNNNQHMPGFEIEGAMQLKADRVKRFENMYQRGEIGYNTFLMESVGYEISKSEGFDFRDPNFWFNRFQANDFSDPRKDTTFLEAILLRSEAYLSQSGIAQVVNGNSIFNGLVNELIGEYRSGSLASDETLSQFFGIDWQNIKKEHDGDVESAIRSLRGHTSMGRLSEDQKRYIHTDGRIYDVVEEGDEAWSGQGVLATSRQSVASLKRNADGSVNSITINNHQLTGNLLIDNIASGATGFLIDLGKTVSQVVAGVIDGTESLFTGEANFDRVVDVGLAFEGFKNSNPLTAKAYVDLDGFQMDSFRDWMNTTGDIVGLFLGMYITGGIGGGIQGAGASIAKGGGTVSKALGGTLNFTGKTLSSISNLHNGSMTRGFQSPLASRTAFAMTHASKDALRVYTYQRLAGKDESEAWASSGSVFLTNSLITMAIGSGSKDDTYRMYRGMAKAFGNRMPVASLANKKFAKLALMPRMRTDQIVTTGLDFFDNYLTMSVASQVEMAGGRAGGQEVLNQLRTLFAGEADFSSVITAAAIAGNAWRGVANDHRTGTISNNSLRGTAKQTVASMNKVIDDPKSTAQDRSTMQFLKSEYDRLVMLPEEQGGGVANALEYVHNATVKDNGQSIVSRTFAKLVRDFDKEAYIEAGKVVAEYEKAVQEKGGQYLFRVMNQGFIRGTIGKIKDWSGGQELSNLRQLLDQQNRALQQQSRAFTRLTDPLNEVYNVMFGTDVKSADERELKANFSEAKLLNDKNFKYNKQNATYEFKVEGKGVLDGDPDFKAFNMVLNQLADAGLITRVTDDKGMTTYSIPSSMNKAIHVAQSVYKMYEGLIELGRLDDSAGAEEYVAVANQIKDLVVHGKDELNPEKDAEIAIHYLIKAAELGYISDVKVVQALDRMFSETEVRDFGRRVDTEIGDYAKVASFIEKVETKTPILPGDLPQAGSRMERILKNSLGEEAAKNIAEFVKEYNERIKKSPQSFASTLETEVLRGAQEELEITFEAESLLNPRRALNRELGVSIAAKELRQDLLDRKVITPGEWDARKNVSVERRAEILKEILNSKVSGIEDIKEQIKTDLAIQRTFDLLNGTVRSDDGKVSFTTETYQVRPGYVLLDKYSFKPSEVYKLYQLTLEWKENYTTLESKNKENLNKFLKANGINLKTLESQILAYEDFLRGEIAKGDNNRFVVIEKEELSIWGYKPSDFNRDHVSKQIGIINGSSYQKGFALDNKINDLTVRYEVVETESNVKEHYRVYVAMQEKGNEFEITRDTLINGGEIGYLFGEITNQRITGEGNGFKVETDVKAVTQGGDAFQRFALAMYGQYFKVALTGSAKEAADSKAIHDIVKHLRENPPKETRINLDTDPANVSQEMLARLGKYWTFELREDGYYLTSFKGDKYDTDVANGIPVSLRDLLALDYIPREKEVAGDILKKGMPRVVIAAEGSLYEVLSRLENDYAVRLIQDTVRGGLDADVVGRGFDETPLVLPSNRVGDIIPFLEGKEVLTPTELSFLRMLKAHLVDDMTLRDQILNDLDLLSASQLKGLSVDDLILYLKDRQDRAEVERNEITLFNKTFFDGEGNFAHEPQDLRNANIVYRYNFDDPMLRTTLKEVLNDLTIRESETSKTRRVNAEDAWKSLIVEVNGKQYLDYEALMRTDNRTLELLRKNLTGTDKEKLELFIKEMTDLIGRTEGRDDLVLEWRAPLDDVAFPTLKETIAFMVRGGDDQTKLDEFVARAAAQLKANADKMRFNDFANAFDEAFNTENKSRIHQVKDRVTESMLASRYAKYFDGKENSDVVDAVRNGARYVFLDENGDMLYSAYGREDLTSVMFSRPDIMEKTQHVVAADINSRSLFEEARMNILSIDEKINGVSLRDRIKDYGDYDIVNWFQQNNPNFKEILLNAKAREDARREFGKNPTSEQGKLYRNFLDKVGDYLASRTSTKRSVDNAIARMIKGDRYENLSIADQKIVNEINNLFNVFHDPRAGEADTTQIAFLNRLENFGDPTDLRVVNSPGERALQQIINGVSIRDLDSDSRQFIETKVENIVKVYTRGIDKETVDIAREFIQKEVAAINEAGQRTARDVPVPDQLKQLDDKQLRRLVYALTIEQDIEQGFNSNTHKFVLNDNSNEEIGYTFSQVKRDFTNGVNFKFDDRFDLANKRIFILDIESLVDDIKNINKTFPLSLSLREIDINTGESKSDELFRFKNTETEELKASKDRTIDVMKNKGDDFSGIEKDYNESIKLTADQREAVRARLLELSKDPKVLVLAHNGAAFDFDKVLGTMFPDISDIFRPGNKTFLDSMKDILPPMTLKSYEINYRSNIEAYRQTALTFKPDSEVLRNQADHSAQGDTKILGEIISVLYNQAKDGITFKRHGQMFREMNDIYKKITGQDFDIAPILDEKINIGSGRPRSDFFGIDKTYDKLTEFQRIKAFKDFMTHRNVPYAIYRDNMDKILKGIKLSERAERLIQGNGVRQVAKIGAFLTTREAKDFERFTKALGVGDTTKDMEVVEALLDPQTYSRENFIKIFGADGEKVFEEFQNFKLSDELLRRSVLEHQFTTAEQRASIERIRGEAPIKRYDYLMKNLFENLNKGLDFIDDEYKEPIFKLIANSYRDHFAMDEDAARNLKSYKVEEVDLFKFIRNNEKINKAADLALEKILDQIGGGMKDYDSSYGNARFMGHNEVYRVQTKTGFEERKLQANEVGITKEAATNLFGEGYDADDLYGWVLRYPTVNKQSFIPMKYVVIESEYIKGNQFVIDDNVMLSIEGDYDGDKFSIFAHRNQTAKDAIKFLNETYLAPYVAIRNYLEDTNNVVINAQRDSITKYFLDANRHYDEFKKDPTYLDRLFKDVDIDSKTIADFKKFIQEADDGKQTSVQVQKFLRSRSLINDQQKGMNLKDTSKASIQKYIAEYEAFYNDKGKVLARGDVRDVAFTDRTIDMMVNRGMTEEAAKDFILNLNNEMLRNIRSDENNTRFSDLLTAVDDDGEVRKSIDIAMRKADEMDSIMDTLLEVNKGYFFADDDSLRNDTFKQTILDLLDYEKLGLDAVEKVDNYIELLNTNELVMFVLDDTPVNNELLPTDTYIPSRRMIDNLVVNKATTVVRKPGFSVSRELNELRDLPNARISDKLNDKNIRKQLIDVLIGKAVSGSQKYFGDELKYNDQWFAALRNEMIIAVEAEVGRGNNRGVELRSALDAVKKRLAGPNPPFVENLLKELIMLNGIKNKKVSKDTTLKNLLQDKTFNSWMKETYDLLDDSLRLTQFSLEQLKFADVTPDQLRIFNTEFDFVESFREFERYLNNYQTKNEINVYKGMPIYSKGKETITSPVSGKVTLTDDGAIFTTQSRINQEALKMAGQGQAAFKAMPFSTQIDNIDFDLIIGGQNISSRKLNFNTLKPSQNLGRTTVTINGKEYTGTLVKSNTFFTENINSWKENNERNGSIVIDDSKGGRIDVTSFLANLNTALGRVLFNKDQIEKLVSLQNKYTPDPVVEQDMSSPMALLKYFTILRGLSPEQRAEATGTKVDGKLNVTDEVVYDIDNQLSILDKFIVDNKINKKDIINKIMKDAPPLSNTTKKTIRMLEGILDYDDYIPEHTMYINGNEISYNKGSAYRSEKEIVTPGRKQLDFEYADTFIRVPGLKELKYSDFMERLGLYYDRYADREAFDLGWHNPSRAISLGVGNRFRNVNENFAQVYNDNYKMSQIVDATKSGAVTKGMDTTYTFSNPNLKAGDLQRTSAMPTNSRADEVYKDIMNKGYSDVADAVEINSRQNYTLAKAMDAAKQMSLYNNDNSVERFKAGLVDRPVKMISSDNHLYSSLNFAKDPRTGQLKMTGVINKGEISYDLNSPQVMRLPGSADFFDIKKQNVDLSNLSVEDVLRPDSIVKVPFQPLSKEADSLRAAYDKNLQEANEQLRTLRGSKNSVEAEFDKVKEQIKMGEPETQVNRGVFNFLKETFRVEGGNKAIENNIDAVLNKSWWRSMGIKYDSQVAYQVHSALQRAATLSSYTRQIYTNRIVNLMDAVRASGPLAKEQFSQYYLFSRLLVELTEKQALDSVLGPREVFTETTQRDLIQQLGASSLEDAISKMKTFVQEYGLKNRNGVIVDELWGIQKDLLDDYRTANNKTGSPIDNSYVFLFPIINAQFGKDGTKVNFQSKLKQMIRPEKYDGQVNLLKLHNPTDIMEGLYSLAKDIAEINSKIELSKDLIQAGVLRNNEVKNVASKFIVQAFDEVASAEGAYKANNLLGRMLGQLYSNLAPDHAEFLRSSYERMIKDQPSKHNIKAFLSASEEVKVDIYSELSLRYGAEVWSIEDIRARMRDVSNESELMLLSKAENTISFLEESIAVLVTGTKAAEDFKTQIFKEAGTRYNLVDRYGRKLDKDYVKPLSESSMEFLKTSMEYNDSGTFLKKALTGDLFFGNKTFTDILDSTMYRKPKEGIIFDILRKTQNTFNRFQFGNPFRLIRRFENFTFTDSWMVAMANPKAIAYLGEARRLLSQSLNADRANVDPRVIEFQRHAGSLIDTASYVDYFSRQTDVVRNPFEARNFVKKTFDVSLQGLTFQHQLARFALFLATRAEIEKTGKIQSYGAGYRFKNFIDGIENPSERAYRLMQMNIATFGDFPIMVRDIAPWLMLTTFTLGQARWAADWGVSMKEAALDVFKAMREGAREGTKQDLSAAYRTLAYPSVVTGLGMSLGWALIQWLSSVYGVDEETKQEWLDEGRYLEVVGTLVNGAPTFTASKASPVDIVFDDWIKTGIKGYQKDKSVIDAATAYWNKHIVSRANPAFKIPIESFTGKNYFGEFAQDDRYATNFMENFVRKSAGTLVGTGTVNAYLDNMRFREYSNDERGLANSIFAGMRDSIGSEFGNTRAYKKDVKDFYFARSLVHSTLNEEGYYDQIAERYNSTENSSSYMYEPNNYDADKAADLTRVFRTMMTRNEPVSTLYAIVEEELRKGTAIPTIHSALNRVSVIREMNKLQDPQGFLTSLSEQDRARFVNAIEYEQKMFPGIAEINLYDLAGGTARRSYNPRINRPYYRQPFKPYKRFLPNMNYKSSVNFYNNMNTYHPYYQPGSIYERWAKPEEGIKDRRAQTTRRQQR
jgi:hypothetical protein